MLLLSIGAARGIVILKQYSSGPRVSEILSTPKKGPGADLSRVYLGITAMYICGV